jgi:hypothetical protein
MADEQAIINCTGCGVPILTWWASGNHGLLRGDYVLIADTVWHPKCWEKQTEKYAWPELPTKS